MDGVYVACVYMTYYVHHLCMNGLQRTWLVCILLVCTWYVYMTCVRGLLRTWMDYWSVVFWLTVCTSLIAYRVRGSLYRAYGLLCTRLTAYDEHGSV